MQLNPPIIKVDRFKLFQKGILWGLHVKCLLYFSISSNGKKKWYETLVKAAFTLHYFHKYKKLLWVLQKEINSNSKHNNKKAGTYSQGVGWLRLSRQEIRKRKWEEQVGFKLSQLSRILAEDKPGQSDTAWGRWRRMSPILCWGWGCQLNQLISMLADTEQCTVGQCAAQN